MFGSSKELIESARSTISGEMFVTVPMVDLASRTDVAKEVSASSFCYSFCLQLMRLLQVGVRR